MNTKTNQYGSTFYYNEKDQHHRDGGLPAVEYADGDKEWWVNGKLHRDNGLPAIEYADGDKEWWVNGKLHRDNGLPAIEYADGDKEWWVNGKNMTEAKAKKMFNKITWEEFRKIFDPVFTKEKGWEIVEDRPGKFYKWNIPEYPGNYIYVQLIVDHKTKFVTHLIVGTEGGSEHCNNVTIGTKDPDFVACVTNPNMIKKTVLDILEIVHKL